MVSIDGRNARCKAPPRRTPDSSRQPARSLAEKDISILPNDYTHIKAVFAIDLEKTGSDTLFSGIHTK